VADEIEELHQKRRPVLVGTVSIEKSERLSNILKKRGISYHVLNAKQHQREAEIIAQAGRAAAATISTNMAGRGTDILLGGNPRFLAGLSFSTEATEGEKAKALERAMAIATKEKDEVLDLGGLHIIGTERHESRRIDNQLRGRAGRQGDPGTSRFCISLEDDLMRVFAGDWVRGFLAKMGMADGAPIDSSLVSRQIEKAQKRVEEYNFDGRKNLLEYDEVMNEQRKIVYEQRQEMLRGEFLRETVLDMLRDLVEDAVTTQAAEGDFRELVSWCQRHLGLNVPLDDVDGQPEDELQEDLYRRAVERYEQRERRIGPDELRRLEQFVLLRTLDMKWKDHLYGMDQVRGQINLRVGF